MSRPISPGGGPLGCEDNTLIHRWEPDDRGRQTSARSEPRSRWRLPTHRRATIDCIQRSIHQRPLALGTDDDCVTPGDLFAQMRASISSQHATVFDLKLAGKAGLPHLMSTRDAIRYATVDGARVAGWGGVSGSLEPGMQADVIVLRTDRPNIFPVN